MNMVNSLASLWCNPLHYEERGQGIIGIIRTILNASTLSVGGYITENIYYITGLLYPLATVSTYLLFRGPIIRYA